ncbi:GNAT family N-acetyltransferase [Hyphomonas sp. WL0036]|uniref:GNAT family N-acetyltransferase n=1 Tax=Hyphomonas sediminis TaxID=2866160 RepID=UPI001C7F0358|nr:GNAT family N-acetyltransferase [Hyphomonas sediminis]MBY9066643.1 GNAT family N-acetyltransferase [Hyphomonas sediminis]
MSKQGFSTHLKTGDAVYLRPIGPRDRAREVQLISGFSDHSRYLRFFTGAKTVPDAVIDRLVDVDGYHHIAWGALDLDGPGAPLMGVVRAMRRGEGEVADLAMGVLDKHHGKGLARLLMAAVVHDALAAGITHFVAETLAENSAARNLFLSMGGHATGRDGLVVTFEINPIIAAEKLDAMVSAEALRDLREAIGPRLPAPAPVIAS